MAFASLSFIIFPFELNLQHFTQINLRGNTGHTNKCAHFVCRLGKNVVPTWTYKLQVYTAKTITFYRMTRFITSKLKISVTMATKSGPAFRWRAYFSVLLGVILINYRITIWYIPWKSYSLKIEVGSDYLNYALGLCNIWC